MTCSHIAHWAIGHRPAREYVDHLPAREYATEKVIYRSFSRKMVTIQTRVGAPHFSKVNREGGLSFGNTALKKSQTGVVSANSPRHFSGSWRPVICDMNASEPDGRAVDFGIGGDGRVLGDGFVDLATLER
ncbi:hypothetical protein SARC_00442 [Sphaeroforma arctica JP610]|uniref:Uncharacterized protein n=1 Tax=Sphaeroforma arctica JP610 TaxID=667725 RepID=A0A0L0GEL8_9EUKA|nr:hypothetical protein SARC_00442 [Sphaeroforma arctica JP610]KNC87460.1 hypothetical protein SARC_00442 [Sphaeroforma arctica JP610]|eukprot:XP_014161362.1 hypothetical protein SARC_00442 [Sphaeroforma arctica JP610]